VPEGPSAESASIAHHYSRAARREDVQRAVHFYELAASWSTARGAFEDAPDFVDRALELLDQTRPDASLRKCRLMLQLGDALTNAGERERAREVLLNAAQIAEQRDLRQEIVAAALRFAPDFLAIESGVYDFELVDLIERAIVALGDSAPALRARLLARLAIALQWNRDQAPRRRDLWDEARLIASAVDDIETKEFVTTVGSLMDFDSLRSFSSSGTEPQPLFQQRNRAVSASLELLRGLARITSLIIRGHIDKADEEILLFAELAERSKHPQARWYVELMRATRAQMDGRFDEAHERGLRFLELGRRYADRNAIHSYEAQQVMRAFDVGAIEAYEARMRAMVAAFPRMVAWRAGLALLLLELNRVEEARSELTRVVGAGALTGLSPNEWYVTTAALALTCGRIGDRALAAETYSLLLPHADELVVFGYCTYCLGSTHRLLATLASHMGQWEVASSHFDSAIARNLAAGSRVSNARVHYERALMLRAAGRESEALRAAGQAERIAVEFGMVRLAGQCCALVELD
jgi:tetratricopeptide (TPR) repeat protein